jgi:GntR family transcriptional regulator
MKIWLAKNSEIPVREQLLTQITLGIVSGDLNVGDKIPSTREIARRFDIHSNTVSSVYRTLSEQGLLEFKKGSGFYVRRNQTENASAEIKLEKLINEFFQTAENLGFSAREIQYRLKKWFVIHPPEHFLVIESDAKLRDILIEEIAETVDLPVFGIGYEEFKNSVGDSNAVIAAMIDEKPKLEGYFSNDKRCIFLKARSVADSMNGVSRPSADDLIAVVSGWEKFTLWAKTILIAAKIEPENLIVRSTGEKDWRKGLKAASMIICDSLTAKNFPNNEKVRVFQVIADNSRRELQEKINGKS